MRPFVDSYKPSTSVLIFAARLRVVGVIGPIAAGKNTLMAASGLTIAGGETSRAQRPGETSYQRYYDFSDLQDREDARTNIYSGRYLQITAHPASGEFYASLPEHYDPSSPNLMDVTSAEYKRMQKARLIGNLTGVYIVPQDYNAWQSQWTGRDGEVDPDTRMSRTREAYDSMMACLPDIDIPFLVNDTVDESAARLRALAEGDQLSQEEWVRGRMTATQMLLDIRKANGLTDYPRTDKPFPL